MLKVQKQIENIQKSVLQQMKSEDKNISLSLPSGCGKIPFLNLLQKIRNKFVTFYLCGKKFFLSLKKNQKAFMSALFLIC